MEKAEHSFKSPTFEKHREPAAFGRGSAFGMQPASTTLEQVSHRTLSGFLLFHLSTQARTKFSLQNRKQNVR
jgi:hypothetical protein